MKNTLVAALVLGLAVPALHAQQTEIDRWWSIVAYLANDGMQGRQTGSKEHREAANYIAEQFKKAGLKPGANGSYLQPVKLVSRTLDEGKSSLTIVRDGTEERVEFGTDVLLSLRVLHAPRLEASMVFAGYGLTIPELKYDDLSGLDVKGKIVVLLTGIPPGVPGPLYSHYNTLRWKALQAAGAIGAIQIQNPKGQDVPWDRQAQNRLLPSMVLEDPSMDDNAGQQLALTANPTRSEKWFTGSGHTFKEILELSDAGKPLPKFPLKGVFRSVVSMGGEAVTSENVVGILPGTDPRLRNEYVVVSAHLDHLGIGNPVNGDSIFNGAMDNASGIATLIETAAAAASIKGLKRSIAFVAVTAEEKGLLGSRYFATRPALDLTSGFALTGSRSAGVMVANMNTDMYLPLFPLKSVVVQGLEESDLAGDLRAVAGTMKIEVLSDPEPERNAFTRSDQYSFIRRGVPALSLKVGFTKDSPEHELVKKWRAERYHSVLDDLTQPVDKQAAVDFNRIYAKVVEAVANRATRPAWNKESFFKRFENPANQ